MTNSNVPLPNIIFLDADGVICTNRACLAVGETVAFSYLDPIALLLIKKLCVDCNAKIVISSMWRFTYDKDAFEAILSAACPKLGSYIWNDKEYWRTPLYAEKGHPNHSERGTEIKQWIDLNSTLFNNFVILDDMADMQPLQDSLVKCDTYNGIGFLEYYDAEKILMERL